MLVKRETRWPRQLVASTGNGNVVPLKGDGESQRGGMFVFFLLKFLSLFALLVISDEQDGFRIARPVPLDYFEASRTTQLFIEAVS